MDDEQTIKFVLRARHFLFSQESVNFRYSGAGIVFDLNQNPGYDYPEINTRIHFSSQSEAVSLTRAFPVGKPSLGTG
jgi:hypothetical protein